jgi:hypothetical protein
MATRDRSRGLCLGSSSCFARSNTSANQSEHAARQQRPARLVFGGPSLAGVPGVYDPLRDPPRAGDELLGVRGVGPLLERDYWAVIGRCRLTPEALIERLRRRFWEFAPEDFVHFCRSDGQSTALEVGDELTVTIRMVGLCRVRVVHQSAQSITLGTLVGHPEAGRITFGAYRKQDRNVVFHIRSHARTSSSWFALGYAAAGEAMQTSTWTDFVGTVARTFGDGVLGVIRAETKVLSESEAEDEDPCTPTFHAVGN